MLFWCLYMPRGTRPRRRAKRQPNRHSEAVFGVRIGRIQQNVSEMQEMVGVLVEGWRNPIGGPAESVDPLLRLYKPLNAFNNTHLTQRFPYGRTEFQALRAFRRARPHTCIFSKTSLFGRFQAIWSCPSP